MTLLRTIAWRPMAVAGVFAGGLASLNACGDETGAQSLATETAQVGAAIQGGYRDEQTSGVVGLGVQFGQHVFAGHCSGTLIAPNLVLTARHCVMALTLDEDIGVDCELSSFQATMPPERLYVSPETERPTSIDDSSLVQAASVHPVPGADSVCGYDVALLILKESISASQATPIVPRIDAPVQPSEIFSAAGYGLTEPSSTLSGTRNRIDEKIVLCAQGGCDAYADGLISPKEWASANAGVCSGDSGGPALDDEGRVIGVVSRGAETCKATIFADVASWSDFIRSIAVEAAEQGGYEPPFWTSGSSDESARLASEPAEPVDSELDERETLAEEPRSDDPDCQDAEFCGGEGLRAEQGCGVVRSRLGASRWGLALLVLGLFGLCRRRLRSPTL